MIRDKKHRLLRRSMAVLLGGALVLGSVPYSEVPFVLAAE